MSLVDLAMDHSLEDHTPRRRGQQDEEEESNEESSSDIIINTKVPPPAIKEEEASHLIGDLVGAQLMRLFLES